MQKQRKGEWMVEVILMEQGRQGVVGKQHGLRRIHIAHGMCWWIKASWLQQQSPQLLGGH